MAQQETNLEQTDFSAGLITDSNPLQFPPNATIDEVNFQIEKDGSRRRRKGLLLEADVDGVLYTPASDFYSEATVRSKVYSTISPNPTVDTSYTARKKDVVTLTDDRVTTSGGAILSFDAETDTLDQIPHSQTNGNAPYHVCQFVTKQAYTSVDSSETNFLLSLIYGHNGSELGVTDSYDVEYNGGSLVQQQDARLTELLEWSGRLVYGFNSNDDTRGYAIGISALPDPTTAASDQVQLLAQCQQIDEDIASTDGAWIYVGDLGKIEKIVPFRTGLLIFTQENIWFLSAPSGYFDPYDFSFDKLATVRVSSGSSVLTADKSIFFWADSGIYGIYPDENSGLPAMQNITSNKIQKLYETFVPEARANSRGVYNKERNEVRWMYSNDPTDFDISSRLRFQNELILDLSSGAFTKNTFGETDDTYLIDYIPDRASEETITSALVIDSAGEQVVLDDGEEVYVEYLTDFSITSNFKYVIRDGDGQARMGALEDTTFHDFTGSVGFPEGSDAAAYLKTGHITFTGTQRRKSPNWLTTTFEATESGYDVETDELLTPSGCNLTAYWDFSNDDQPAKVHGPYPVYKLNRLYMPETNEWNYGQDYISTKNKIRGRGRALQFLFTTEEGKDCRLYSWGYNGKILTRV